jgi:AraC-like DNA-binding protein
MALGLAARLAVKHLERSGIDAAPLLTASGLSRSAIAERQRISVASQMRFLKLVSIASKDAWLGVTLAQEFDLREMGMLYYVAASSHQLGDALKRISRYVRLGNEALVVQLKGLPVCFVQVSYSGVQRHRDRDQMELLTCAFLRLCRKLVGRNLTPRAVKFVHHRSGDLSPIRRMFGCDVKFDAEADEIMFDEQVAELPVLSDDPYLNELIVKMCDEAIAGRTTNAGPFRIVVENTIAPLLPHAEASTKTVAKLLNLSERTFSRRLAAEGVGFAEILDELRRDLAVRYLEENLQASQIAWLLGFNQPSSFSHACRRWTGKSPLEIRRARKFEPAG